MTPPPDVDAVRLLTSAIQTGGSAALVMCAWFIFRASERLARIEKALEKYMVEKN